MAFAKTPKLIRNGVLSVYFKIGLKLSSFKKLQNFNFCLTSYFCLSCELPGISQGLWGNFQPPWPISQTLRWKNAIFTCIWNHSVLQNGELSFSNGWNSISRYFFSQNPKTRIEKISISQAILLEFLRSPVSALRCEANKIKRRREESWLARHQNVEGPAAARAVPRGMSRRRMRAPK